MLLTIYSISTKLPGTENIHGDKYRSREIIVSKNVGIVILLKNKK